MPVILPCPGTQVAGGESVGGDTIFGYVRWPGWRRHEAPDNSPQGIDVVADARIIQPVLLGDTSEPVHVIYTRMDRVRTRRGCASERDLKIKKKQSINTDSYTISLFCYK